MFLMPSQYEPCGLNQMYSLRYGTIPIVRRTGGLADSVQHFDPDTRQGTGVVFNDYDASGLTWGDRNRAGLVCADRACGDAWCRTPWRMDFSWETQVREYVALYEHARSAQLEARPSCRRESMRIIPEDSDTLPTMPVLDRFELACRRRPGAAARWRHWPSR